MKDATAAVPAEPQPPDDTTTPESADALGPESTGRWLVQSRGSEHLLDLDLGIYRRTPGPGQGSSHTTGTP